LAKVGEAGGYVATVGERLKEERLLRGWSQRDLARESGTTAETISSIETGQHEPRPSTLRKLAEGLGIEVRDFYAEPALPKADAPRGAGQSRAQRLEDLQTYEAYISEIAEKYRAEAEPLLTTLKDATEPTEEDLDSLITLLTQTGWTFDGGHLFLEQDDVVVEAEKGSIAERRAVARVNSALNAIADVHEAISAALEPHLDPDEEEHRVVVRLDEYLQKRKVG
jgi:transcriptional regulator with XRE-family HTH domain